MPVLVKTPFLARPPVRASSRLTKQEAKKVRGRATLGLIGAFVLSSCGYSEEEWQAQLAKYDQLNAAYSKEKSAHAATRGELAAIQKKVSDLNGQLQKMGYSVEQLSQRLEAEGTEKQRLAMSLEEMKQALAEYK